MGSWPPQQYQMAGAELMRDPLERCWRKRARMWVPSLGARPVIWHMHIHKGPKRELPASCEHIVCGKWPMEDNEHRASDRGPSTHSQV